MGARGQDLFRFRLVAYRGVGARQSRGRHVAQQGRFAHGDGRGEALHEGRGEVVVQAPFVVDAALRVAVDAPPDGAIYLLLDRDCCNPCRRGAPLGSFSGRIARILFLESA